MFKAQTQDIDDDAAGVLDRTASFPICEATTFLHPKDWAAAAAAALFAFTFIGNVISHTTHL